MAAAAYRLSANGTVACQCGTWQRPRMASPSSRSPMSGGFLLALSVIVGALVGGLNGEPSLGLVLGFAAGAAIAGIVWLIDRRRR